MTIYTFTPGDTVDPRVVYSASPDADAGGAFVDATPVGWPMTGKANAIEVELTAVVTPVADQWVVLMVCDDDAAYPVPGYSTLTSGVWSGADGVIIEPYPGVGTMAQGLALNKIGAWRTDYVTFFGGGGSGNSLISEPTGTPPNPGSTGEYDFVARIRIPDLTSPGSTVIAKHFHSELRFGDGPSTPSPGSGGSGTLCLEMWHYVAGAADRWYAKCPVSLLGLVENEWCWVRGSFDPTEGFRWWSSSDGDAWTVAGQVTIDDLETHYGVTYPGIEPSSNWLVFFGNGQNASAAFGNRMDGDMSHGRFSATVGGPYEVQLNLDQMTSQSQQIWSGGVDDIGWYNDGSAFSRASYTTGENIPATVRARIDFDQCFAVDDWRLIIDVLGVGQLTVDEIVLFANCGAIYVDGAAHPR